MTDSQEKSGSTGSSLYAPKSGSDSQADSLFSIPRMGAEVGYDVATDDDVPPFRTSGLVCFILGLLSFSATVAWQMLILPIAAIIFGVIAMRRWTGQRPAGTTVAVIGLLLASGFGAAGVAIPMAKNKTMGDQAVYFAGEYLELVGRGDTELALELRKEARNRQVNEMNLQKAYAEDPIARETMENESENAMIESIRKAGSDIPWELAEPPRVFVKYNNERVDTYWVDPSGRVKDKIQILMQWTPNEKTNTGEWHVNLFQVARELIVAPSVL
ncbi:hypothetical protein FHS27_003386 [Rhodopirellula rubra]|uniref:DUF4190 domain-containing protein n=1 Tax=Aporhodopirellula rubra TaxID=980271 RepID=A0A7W5H743_9BACT|nr:DUF4190 domain-containing protein [Aporhodopirellula rubra]MBB3207561.1 hypothetical protein [Aporhodopirellula rubra]